ncbi:DUF3048 domain-containing protein [Clostridium vincentii]|uniref:Putative lipoprotein YerB n=1 Tax=Clostridium vincentii TaxID=52704 RepID=A0A2T0BHH1_9CLOT|nr:DUF3048 domain-containing protein [Clostridium vincentii]PRR83305.1 putative lipoprotein YerB precursor [Clostridium vincentii]
MKKLFTIILFTITLSTLIVGCETKPTSIDDVSEEKFSSTSQEYSYYTGEECPDFANDKIPFMVMVENSSEARPQSGLSQADIIYETSAEGGIPRFIALFHKNSPSIIGPVRSVRPYFISIAKEYGLPFAHCGGSVEALTTILNTPTLNSINEITNGATFWRDASRTAPHNLYTSSENIEKFIADKGFKITKSPFISFDSIFYDDKELKPSNSLRIVINKYYNTSYSYNEGLYTKSMDDKESVDSYNNESLTFSNIIIQKTSIIPNTDNVHLDIKLLGEGEGYVLSKGKIIDITWSKSSEDSRTILYDKDHNEIPLSPGKTIWHVIDTSTELKFE